MSNQFLVILEKSEEGIFTWFKEKKFNKQTDEILRKNNSNHVLGLHKGVVTDSVWNKIKNDDKIYLTLEDETFRIFGIVSKKRKDVKLGKIIYPDRIDKNQINYFLFFKNLPSCREPFDVLKEKITPKSFSTTGIFKLKEKFNSKQTKSTKINKPLIEKTMGSAEKKWIKFNSTKRNQSNVNQLKQLYHNKCQIQQCDFKLNYKKDGKIKQFSNVHHYNQLSKSLIDSLDNMIVLCPNHHAEFDFKVKLIDYDGKTIIDQNGKKTGEVIKFHNEHKFNTKNIKTYLEKLNG